MSLNRERLFTVSHSDRFGYHLHLVTDVPRRFYPPRSNGER